MCAFALPPMLLVLLATTESVRSEVPCPAHCVNSFAVWPTDGRIKWIRGPDASSVVNIIRIVSKTSPSTSVVTIRINGRDVSVPSSAKPAIIEVLKKRPDLSSIIFEVLQKRQPYSPSRGGPGEPGEPVQNEAIENVPSAPANPTGSLPDNPSAPAPSIPYGPGPEISSDNVPFEPEAPAVPEMPTVPEMPAVPEIPAVPEAPAVPAGPVAPVGTEPGNPSIRQASDEVPDILKPLEFTFKIHTVSEDIRSYLELLVRNPDYFVPIYRILIRKGVRFPDVSKPFTHVTVNGQRVDLPRKVTVVFTIRINGQPFTLPRDGQKLLIFISRHPDQVPVVATILQQFGAVVTTSPGGQITGFVLFGKPYRLPTPVSTRVTVNGRTFNLPQDIPALVATVQSNPQEFHRVLAVLETFGARPRKSATGEINVLEINGRSFPVRSVSPARVTIQGTSYTIPADLNAILKQPDSLVVGELIASLQRLRIPVTVDKDTGNVIGIVMDGVPIPFPVMVRLRVNVGGRVFSIPRDLPSIVTYLQQHGMPSQVLSLLYNYCGVIPVLDANHAVIAVSFNAKQYPVRAQPQTDVTISGNRFVLPRDTNKLVHILVQHKISVEEFLRVIQQAGYKLIPGPDCVLRTVQKGFDVISLPVTLRLLVTVNGVRYRVPSDLPRIVLLFRQLKNPGAIEHILVSLQKLGVRVQRSPNQVTLVFNEQRYSFPLAPGGSGEQPSRPTGTVTIRVNFNNRWFTLPAQLTDLMTVVRSNGPTAIQILVKTLRSQGLTVNTTPDGADIISIVIQGQVYTVSGGSTQGVAPISGGGQGVEVTIRGRRFIIPRDIRLLPRSLPGFQYGELILALHRAGALLEVDQRGNFYGMRVRGRLIKFAVIFRVNVMLDKGGRSFRMPLDLAELARGLSTGRQWNWTVVRKVLHNSGVQVQGGAAGAPRAIGFQGKFYQLRGSVGGIKQ